MQSSHSAIPKVFFCFLKINIKFGLILCQKFDSLAFYAQQYENDNSKVKAKGRKESLQHGVFSDGHPSKY